MGNRLLYRTLSRLLVSEPLASVEAGFAGDAVQGPHARPQPTAPIVRRGEDGRGVHRGRTHDRYYRSERKSVDSGIASGYNVDSVIFFTNLQSHQGPPEPRRQRT